MKSDDDCDRDDEPANRVANAEPSDRPIGPAWRSAGPFIGGARANGRPRVTFWRIDDITDEMLDAWMAEEAFDDAAEILATVGYEGEC